MAERADMELEADGDALAGSSSQPVKKNIALKLKPSPAKKTKGRRTSKGGSRGRKKKEEENEPSNNDASEEAALAALMTSHTSGPPEPLHQNKRLRWDHKVNLIGEKIMNPLIHCCDRCELPILIYGRMIPCKHVFCLDCAKKVEKTCPRCDDPVSKIEQAPLGTVWICTFGGSKHGTQGCRRTYLSIRDLNAHIKYRHKGEQMVKNIQQPEYRIDTGHKEMLPEMYHRPPPEGQNLSVPPPGVLSTGVSSAPPESYRTIPVMSSASRGNLITVQIQDEQQNSTNNRQDFTGGFQGPPPAQASIPSSGTPNFSQPPPHFTPTNQPPPQFSTSVPPPQLNVPPGGTNVAPPSMSVPPPRTSGPPPNYSTAQRPPWSGPGSAPTTGPPQHRAPPPQHPQYY